MGGRPLTRMDPLPSREGDRDTGAGKVSWLVTRTARTSFPTVTGQWLYYACHAQLRGSFRFDGIPFSSTILEKNWVPI